MHEQEDKIQRRFRLTQKELDYIEDVAHELNTKSDSLALKIILREHEKLANNRWSLDYITQEISKDVTNSMKEEVTKTIFKEVNRIRLGTNNTDRNTQILIELLQGFMQMQNLEHIVTTDLNKPPFLTEVENLIQDKITTLKQRKDSKR